MVMQFNKDKYGTLQTHFFLIFKLLSLILFFSFELKRRYITPVLLHGGFLHLFFNVFAQLRFGIVLEKKWGLPKFLLLYIISGIGATLFSCLTRPNEIGVGASGAIMGLMGAFLSEIIMTWKKSDPRIRKMMLFQVILVISITMLFSISQYVDGAAHFGGINFFF